MIILRSPFILTVFCFCHSLNLKLSKLSNLSSAPHNNIDHLLFMVWPHYLPVGVCARARFCVFIQLAIASRIYSSSVSNHRRRAVAQITDWAPWACTSTFRHRRPSIRRRSSTGRCPANPAQPNRLACHPRRSRSTGRGLDLKEHRLMDACVSLCGCCCFTF